MEQPTRARPAHRYILLVTLAGTVGFLLSLFFYLWYRNVGSGFPWLPAILAVISSGVVGFQFASGQLRREQLKALAAASTAEHEMQRQDADQSLTQLRTVEEELAQVQRELLESEQAAGKLRSELEYEVRRSETHKSVLVQLKEKQSHLEQRQLQKSQEFERVKREMEHQIQERAQTEEQLLETQTRLKLINGLSIRLNEGMLLGKITRRAVLDLKRAFSSLRIYFGGVVGERYLKIEQATKLNAAPRMAGSTLDLGLAPEYLRNLKTGKPFIVNEIRLDNRLHPIVERLRRFGLEGLIEIPIHRGGRLVGLLGMGSPVPRRWSSHEVSALAEIGQFLNLAMRDAEMEEQRRRTAEELLRAKEAAEQATRTKSHFLATMSHEIRTPLNGIIGMTGLMMGTRLTAEQREYAQILKSSGEILLTLINDILDFSKIEAGKLELEHIAFDLRSVVEEILEMLAVKAQPKGLDIFHWVPAGIPVKVVGDPGRLGQILINLLNNAIKFTEQGEVRLVTKLLELQEDQQRATLEFRITDTGIGIPADRIDNLFQSFTQVDASTTRKYGGSGLGLAICKRLVEMMGGQIWVESVLGEGSSFIFSVNLELEGEQSMPSLEPDPDLGRHQLLILEPNPHVLASIQDGLEGLGLQVSGTQFPDKALAMLETMAAEDKSPTVFLIDQSFYREGTRDQVARLRDLAPKVPLILMVPLVEKAGVHDLGVEAVVTKPVKLGGLHKIIRLVLGLDADTIEMNTEESAFITENATLPDSRFDDTTAIVDQEAIEFADGSGKGHVLLVDDNETNRRLVALLLKKGGYSFDTATNGKEAVETLGSGRFDLILMDCRMPRMDGFEATRIIRDREQGDRHTPIIALTASAMQDDRKACMDAGMDDFLSKPINPRKLYSVLSRFLGSDHSGATPDPQKSNDEDAPVQLWRLRDATSNDPTLMQEMAVLFLEESQKTLTLIREAVGHRRAEDLREAAHGLKGSCANMGVPALQRAASKLESMAAGYDLDRAAEELGNLEEAYQVAKDYLETTLFQLD